MGRILAVEGVSKSFGGLKAIDNVSLALEEGEVLGIIGPNGSGKTTLMNIVRGLIRPDRGRVEIMGIRADKAPAHRIARMGVASIFQTPRIARGLSVLENAAAGVLALTGSIDAAFSAAAEALEAVGLVGRRGAMAGDLNRYETRLLELARAMAARPRILLIDELLSGFSESEQSRLKGIVRGYLESTGSSALWVEHAVGSLAEEADRLAVLSSGRLIAEGHPYDVLRDEKVVQAYLGR